jgi:hypothetical protein
MTLRTELNGESLRLIGFGLEVHLLVFQGMHCIPERQLRDFEQSN